MARGEVRSGRNVPLPAEAAAPPIIAGSHDPLLEWAARESGSGLAVLACGSARVLTRFAAGGALVAAMHWLDRATGEYNVPLVRERLPGADVVVVEWARRTQGLVVAAGNPLKVSATLADLAKRKARIVDRQPDAGSHQLFVASAAERAASREASWLRLARPALARDRRRGAISDGRADAGVAIEAAARAFGLALHPARNASASISSCAAATTSSRRCRRSSPWPARPICATGGSARRLRRGRHRARRVQRLTRRVSRGQFVVRGGRRAARR